MDQMEAMDMVREQLKERNKEFIALYASTEIVNSKEIKDTFQKEIFEEEASGWFFFIDSCTIANWSHPCEYWLITNDGVLMRSQENWMPSNEIELAKIQL